MTPDEELTILRADWAALVAQVTGAESRRAGDLRRGETFTNSGGEVMRQALGALELALDMSYSELCSERISAAIVALRAALAKEPK